MDILNFINEYALLLGSITAIALFHQKLFKLCNKLYRRFRNLDKIESFQNENLGLKKRINSLEKEALDIKTRFEVNDRQGAGTLIDNHDDPHDNCGY